MVAGVAVAALCALSEAGKGRPAGVVAAIGPCISFEAFEVGPEVVEEFTRVFGPDAPVGRLPDGKGRVDLREAVRRQLVHAGVPCGNVETTDRCSHRDAGEFFSHRRDNGVTGRMAAIISPAR